jgi:hypothetical protein
MEFKKALDEQREKSEKEEKEAAKEAAKNPTGKIPVHQIPVSQLDPDEEPLCEVCFANPPDSVYMPCGHGGMCYDCAIDIWKSSDDCYLCREVCLNLKCLLYFIDGIRF